MTAAAPSEPALPPTSLPGGDAAIPREQVAEILDVARRAPSGTNTQPWKIVALSAPRVQDLVSAVQDRAAALLDTPAARLFAQVGSTAPLPGVQPPSAPVSPAQAARIRAEWDRLRAPFSALCLFDTRLGRGSQLDWGMFLQNVVLAASARGLSVQLLPAWQVASPAVQELLPLQAHESVLCGLTLEQAVPSPAPAGPSALQVEWRG